MSDVTGNVTKKISLSVADTIRETNADGSVLDTQGNSKRQLTAAADSVESGMIMYPEGIAVPKDMQGQKEFIVRYTSMLNGNKLIKPDFAVFRVTEVYKCCKTVKIVF